MSQTKYLVAQLFPDLLFECVDVDCISINNSSKDNSRFINSAVSTTVQNIKVLLPETI